MKKALIFLSFILLVGVFFSFVVSAENLTNSNNIKTEKITCVFNNLDKEETCASYFNSNDLHNNNQYSCKGTGSCSVTINEKEGSTIKMRPMKWCDITDGKTPSAPGKTTIVDGTDKTIEFDCQHRTLRFSLLDILEHFYYNLFFQDKIGYRYAYYLCSDGSEGLFNTSGECTSLSEGRSKVDELCNNNMNAAAFDNCIV